MANMATNGEVTQQALPEGIFSLLDTDLYKLTMQCAILKYYPAVEVSYEYTNRTKEMKFNRAAYEWLQKQIEKLGNIALTHDELDYLRKTCPYLSPQYLDFLSTFRLQPQNQIRLSFHPLDPSSPEADEQHGELALLIQGTWLGTILYEIPLLALISEAYFKFIDTDWTHSFQTPRAYDKGRALLARGSIFSEFGSRRRRDYRTHELVLQGLCQAARDAARDGLPGTLAGTSNVHFAMQLGIPLVGTVAHEWFMGIAALTADYEHASERALRCWVGTFGEGVLGIALTDTFGTRAFLDAFRLPCPRVPRNAAGVVAGELVDGEPGRPSYAEVFTGVRQDSGAPVEFVKMMRTFYDEVGVTQTKTITFSDALNLEKCFYYKEQAEKEGFAPTFGVGTFFTNDFVRPFTNKKSVPLNIVIKLHSAAGNPAIKLSDNLGKNTGDPGTVRDVKQRLGYVEHEWAEGNEAERWGKEGDSGDPP